VTTILAIGGSAAPGDVASALTGGRPARAADGHALVLYDAPSDAVGDVRGYLRLRAMTMVRFGLHVGAPEPVADRLKGPAVAAATRLADLAGPGRLRVSAEAAALLDGDELSSAGDGSYELRKP
jgi:class 3 adenylate cyclase